MFAPFVMGQILPPSSVSAQTPFWNIALDPNEDIVVVLL
jgi:hypothetical protein